MKSEQSNIIPLPSLDAIEAEAAAWVTVMGRPSVSPEELARFQAWMGQSERHRKAFNALSGLWREMEILKELEDTAVPDGWAAPLGRLSRRQFVAAAASIPVAVGAGVFGLKAYDDHRLNQKGEFSTRIGEQKTVRLADGSVVQLNTRSVLRVDYNEAARNIWLLRGEAYFDVAKDPKRPYAVFAADGVVKAVGTAFTVRVRPDTGLEVTVEEGRVMLSSAAAGGPRPESAELSARQSAVFSGRVERIVQMEDAALVQKLAWRQGLLAYAGVPLSDVVADVSRYTDVRIEISDPALRVMPIGGVFRVGEIDALFDSLQLTFGLRIERVSPKLIRISKTT